MTNAVSDEHAMMFPLQNADVANIAVPSSWGSHTFTGGAKFPTRILMTEGSTTNLVLVSVNQSPTEIEK